MSKLQKLKPPTPAKPKAEVKPKEPCTDIALQFSLSLTNTDGTPVKVEGTIPLQGGLIPVFLADTHRTLESLTNTVVRDRFLLQVRHFINQLRQDALPAPTDNQLLELDQRVGALPNFSDTQEDAAFDFEEEVEEEGE